MPASISTSSTPLIGLPSLMTAAMRGQDLRETAAQLQSEAEAGNSAAIMDLAVLLQLWSDPDTAIALQAEALKINNVYSFVPSEQRSLLRVLSIAAPGDLMTNTPLEFLAEGAGFRLDTLYISSELGIPETLPDHDVAIIAISELDRNQTTLDLLNCVAPCWLNEVLNPPERIMQLRRDIVPIMLSDRRTLVVPATCSVTRHSLLSLVNGETSLDQLLVDGEWPILIRPIDSHAGKGLARIDNGPALEAYLNNHSHQQFFLTQFVDYCSNHDGQYRKYRIMMIGGEPHLAHMGIFEDWMVHYDSAGMKESAAKRQEEAHVMQHFADDLAGKHAEAFSTIYQAVGLDYFGIDCGETRDGKLLIFEICASLAIHAMDPVDLFPYKQPQMTSIFNAFEDMLYRHYMKQINDTPDTPKDIATAPLAKKKRTATALS